MYQIKMNDIIVAKRMANEGHTLKAIANRLGIGQTTAQRIVTGARKATPKGTERDQRKPAKQPKRKPVEVLQPPFYAAEPKAFSLAELQLELDIAKAKYRVLELTQQIALLASK
jgi:transposase